MKQNLSNNLQELKKDLKGIWNGIVQIGASSICTVKDTLKLPLSIIADVRDGKTVSKAIEDNTDNEDKSKKSNKPKKALNVKELTVIE